MITLQPLIRAEGKAVSTHTHLLTFIAHRCQCAAHFGVPYKSLRAAYLTWCKDYDLRPALNDRFCEGLAALGYQERSGGSRWEGLRLIES